jgi:hypothetical protein
MYIHCTTVRKCASLLVNVSHCELFNDCKTKVLQCELIIRNCWIVVFLKLSLRKETDNRCVGVSIAGGCCHLLAEAGCDS